MVNYQVRQSTATESLSAYLFRLPRASRLFALLHRFHRRGEVLVALSQSHVHPELFSIVVISLVMISLHNLLSSIGASNSEPWSRDEVARPVSTPPLYASIRTI